MPWRPDGKSGTSTVDLPADYFILLPLAGHRRLYSEFGPDGGCPASERSRSIFLQPFAKEDTEKLAQFSKDDSWRMMQILHSKFRRLAPPDLAAGYDPPAVAAAAAGGRSPASGGQSIEFMRGHRRGDSIDTENALFTTEVGGAAETYQLMRGR